MEINTEHIIAYFEDRLSSEDNKEFEAKLKSSSDLQKEVDNLRFIFETTREINIRKDINTSKNWRKLSWRIRLHKGRKKIGYFIRTSAAILLIPALFASYFLYDRLEKWNTQYVEQIELTTAYGLVSKVTLPDSSEVWMNSGSTISYPKQFAGWRRTVHISGEAYFKVSSDRLNRFDVITPNGILVSAYGTEFNVSAYEDDNEIHATLVKGNIEINKTEESEAFILDPGQEFRYNKTNDQIEIAQTNILVKTAWKDGKMVFRRANMTEITQRLSRHFNVNIELKDAELYDYEYSATFTTETLDEIIFLLEKTAPIKCQVIEPVQTQDLSFSKRTVIIRKK